MHRFHLPKDIQRSLFRLLLIAVVVFSPSLAFAQAGQAAIEDSAFVEQVDLPSVTSHEPEDFVDDGFAPGLGLFALFALITMLVLIGIGVALGLALLLILFGLIAGGIISGSVLVGLYQRSFASGFLTFLASAGAIGGAIIGSVGLWLLHRVMHWPSGKMVWAIGGAGGLAAGIILGIGAYYALRGLARMLKGVRGS